MSAPTDASPASAYRRGLPLAGDGDGVSGRPRVRRHAIAGGIVAAYGLAACAVPLTGSAMPVPRWLALHLLLLGAATNAVLVYSRHFAQSLLHTGRQSERWATARLAALNAGVLATLSGVAAEVDPLVVVGVAGVVAAVGGHLASILGMLRRNGHAGKLRDAVWYYLAAGVSLVAGAILGGLMATGSVHDPALHQGLHAAHAHLNLLGWLGLTVIGTLFMLWPAVLRTRMVEQAPRTARQSLALLVAGLAVAVTGLLVLSSWLATAGLLGYAAGLVLSLRPFLRTARQRPPHSAAAWFLAAATAWFLVGLGTDIAGVARGGSDVEVGLTGAVPILAAGLVAQVLVGALTFLLPATMGGGPAGNRRLTAALERFWVSRLVLGNAGVLLLALPFGSVHAAGWVVAATGFGSFAFLVTGVLPRPSWLGRDELLAGAAVLAVLAALGLVTTGTWPARDAAAPAPSRTATSGAPLDVSIGEFYVRPATITVPAGTSLELRVRNDGHMAHDLKLGGRTGTRMLSPHQAQTVDFGVIHGDAQAWCTVPGHRQAGMLLTIRVLPDAGLAHPTGAVATAARDAALAPAPGGTEHQVTLRAVDERLEVAPGVHQTLWTFEGTVPGPVLRGRVGDVFTVTLVNAGTMPHSLDFHAEQVAPALGMQAVPPGGSVVYRFRADHAGAWLYHCGVAPMLQHVAMGMYGAIIIDPPNLPPVSKELVLVQSEIWRGRGGAAPPLRQIQQDAPDYVVFNGRADQYTAEPISVPAGTRLRVWLVDAGPDRAASLHVVGAQFDTVFKEGGYLLRPGNAESGAASQLDLLPGAGGFVELTLAGPGRYPFMTHRLGDAARGAMGVLEAS